MSAVHKVVVAVDLARFSDASSVLAQQLGAGAVKQLQDLIVDFVRGALADVGLELGGGLPSGVPHVLTGDGAILALDDADAASRFGAALHRRTAAWNEGRGALARRHFRVGAYAGELVIEPPSEGRGWDLAGDVIARAVRLESACGEDEVLIAAELWDRLSPEEQALYQEVETVRGKRDERFEARRRGPDPRNPYKGLAAFGEDDAAWYFGRDAQAEELAGRLHGGARLVTLVGASGSGKSSLLGAGLVPRLRLGEDEERWVIARMRPGSAPFAELAKSLRRVGFEADGDELEATPAALGELIDGGGVKVLLVVDQFEELFTAGAGELEAPRRRNMLVAALLAAARHSRRLYTVLALRADFLGDALAAAGELPEMVRDSLYLLTPMQAEQLERAIEDPATAVGLTFEEGLVETLVDGVAGEPGDLPLLQFTLDQLWRRREGRRLTWQAYRAIGELRGAIGGHADRVLSELAGDQQRLVRRLFGRLVRLGEGVADTRRRVAREELDGLAAGSAELVARLVDERLLTAQERHVEIAHEALIRHWPTLRAWIDQDRESLRVQQAVARAAAEWRRDGRQAEDLWRGGRLQRLVEMTAESPLTPLFQRGPEKSPLTPLFQRGPEKSPLTPLFQRGGQIELGSGEREFLRASRRRARRATWAMWLALVAALALAAAASAAAWWAIGSRQLAEQRLDEARGVADFIVFTVDRRLKKVAGAAEAQRELLEAGRKLIETLTPESVGDLHLLRSQMVNHGQRGDLAVSHDDLAAARVEYEKTLELARQLDAAQPDNPVYKRDLSVSYDRLGDIARAAGDLDAARDAYRQALEIAKTLAEADTENAGWQRDLSVSYNKLGDVAVAAGELDVARDAYRKALEIRKTLAEADTENAGWQRDLSVSYNRLGDVAVAAGDLDAARDDYRQALEIAKTLAEADTENAGWQRDLSVSYNKLGDVARAAGELDAARDAYRQALEIAKTLAEADPENAGWQRDLSVSYEKLGDVAVAAGDLDAARDAYRQALEIRKTLAEADPENAGWQRDLSVSYEKLGDVAVAAGDLDAARDAYRQALEIAKTLAEADPGNPSNRRDLILSHGKLMMLAQRAGDDAEFRRHLDEQVRILADFDRDGLFIEDAQLNQIRTWVKGLAEAAGEPP